MHGVNLDLLRAYDTHHRDGSPKDRHAHHRAEHLATRRAARNQALHKAFTAWLCSFRKYSAGRKPVSPPVQEAG